MKIPNRIYTTIINARMIRVAKQKAVSCKRNLNKSVSSKNRNSSVSRIGKQLESNRLLTNILGQENTTNKEKLAENRAQKLLYSRMRSAASWVIANAEKLLETGETAIFDNSDKEQVKEASVAEIKNFVNNYNIMMGRLNSSGETVDTAYAKKIQGYFTENSRMLEKLGITASDNGILQLDEKKLKDADISDIENVFHGENCLAGKVRKQAELVKERAEKKIADLEKSSYAISLNYTRYGKSENGYDRSNYNFRA